jgi:hypothetical protein
MGYDKRVIVTPTVPMEECTQVYTLPHGHKGALARGINDWFKDSTLKGEDRMNIVNMYYQLFVINFYNIKLHFYIPFQYIYNHIAHIQHMHAVLDTHLHCPRR